MDSSTHPWLSVLRPKSRPSVITSLPRARSLSLLRDHQTTPPTITPTTSNTMMIATASKALSQPGIAVLRFGNSHRFTQIDTDTKSKTTYYNQLPYLSYLCTSVLIRG